MFETGGSQSWTYSAGRADGVGADTLMLAEYLHRSANDLAVALSALNLAGDAQAEPRSAVLADARSRIEDAASMQRLLIPPAQGGTTDLAAVLLPVCEVLGRTCLREAGAELHLVVEAVEVDRRTAWSVAAVVTELVGNSRRHAFADRGGRIDVVIRDDDEGLAVSVADDGRGTGGGRTCGRGRGSGIVDALVAGLGGGIGRSHLPRGTLVEVVIPDPARTGAPMRACAAAPAVVGARPV